LAARGCAYTAASRLSLSVLSISTSAQSEHFTWTRSPKCFVHPSLFCPGFPALMSGFSALAGEIIFFLEPLLIYNGHRRLLLEAFCIKWQMGGEHELEDLTLCNIARC